MKLPARNVVWLLPLLLTACAHKTPAPQGQRYTPPPSTVPKPETEAVELPPSVATIPSEPLSSNSDLHPAPKPPARHRRPVKSAPQVADAAPPPAIAPPAAPAAPPAPVETPAVSAIGQLSSGDHSDSRQQTLDSIAATERGLIGLNRSLNDQEQKTAAQIREFLKQAREALASGDVDGAHTLAAKAKVLLSELAGK